MNIGTFIVLCIAGIVIALILSIIAIILNVEGKMGRDDCNGLRLVTPHLLNEEIQLHLFNVLCWSGDEKKVLGEK
jgi:hypothetical protein